MLTSVQHFLGAFDNTTLGGDAFNGMHPERTVTLGKAWNEHVFHDRQVTEDFRRLKHPADTHLIDL
jgi:hypothetical protein